MSYSADCEAFAKKTNSTLGEAAKAIKISLFNGIILDTRVKYGRLRGNWQTSTGFVVTSIIERIDPAGSASTKEVAENVTDDGVDYMSNNLPYAEVYEEKDGMIKKNMQRIDRIVKEVSRG